MLSILCNIYGVRMIDTQAGQRSGIHNDNAVRAAIVAAGDRAEPLLPSSIPLSVRSDNMISQGERLWGLWSKRCARQWHAHDLQLDCLSVELDGADFLRARGDHG